MLLSQDKQDINTLLLHYHRASSPPSGRRSFIFIVISFGAGIFHRVLALSAHADSAIQAIAPRGRDAPAKLMQDYAKTFYKSKAWQACREAYLKQKHGLCEQCMRRGIYTPADTVHHVRHITPDNITDPSVTLNPENLMALCRDCHAEMHKGKRRYMVDKYGRVTAR